MNKHFQNRSRILLKATLDILKKWDQGSLLKNVFEQVAIWDNCECDGYCLKEEIEELLKDMENIEKEKEETMQKEELMVAYFIAKYNHIILDLSNKKEKDFLKMNQVEKKYLNLVNAWNFFK